MMWVEDLLRRFIPHKEIGWTDIDEKFTRFQLIKSEWFNVYLHKLECLQEPPHSHDHPWNFLALVIKGGYWETINNETHWRWPGSVLYRKATSIHRVKTDGVNWSLVITGRRIREWKFIY